MAAGAVSELAAVRLLCVSDFTWIVQLSKRHCEPRRHEAARLITSPGTWAQKVAASVREKVQHSILLHRLGPAVSGNGHVPYYAAQRTNAPFCLVSVRSKMNGRDCGKKKPARPHELVLAQCRAYLESRGLWRDNLVSEVPHGWERYGDLIVLPKGSFTSHEWWDDDNNQLWEGLGKVLRADRLALQGPILASPYRSPSLQLVLGSNPWATKTENGVTYTWDVTQCMFSRGNFMEKKRMGQLKCETEVVVDAFAGIGYFTLPLLVGSKAKHLFACEWNPAALDALKRNLSLNGINTSRVTICAGDCRVVCPQNVADRVVLGLIPSSKCGWEVACRALKSETGGIIHLHGVDRNGGEVERQSWGELMASEIKKLLDKMWACPARVTVKGVYSVKSYAPKLHHYVADLSCTPVCDSYEDVLVQ